MAENKKNKHLIQEDRKENEDCLCRRMSFKAIAKLISKDPTTLFYEVKHHRTDFRNSYTSTDEISRNFTIMIESLLMDLKRVNTSIKIIIY